MQERRSRNRRDEDKNSELLARIDERVLTIHDKLESLLRRAENGGWSRCAKRGEQIKELGLKLDEHKDSHKWFSRSVFVIAVSQILLFLFALLDKKI